MTWGLASVRSEAAGCASPSSLVSMRRMIAALACALPSEARWSAARTAGENKNSPLSICASWSCDGASRAVSQEVGCVGSVCVEAFIGTMVHAAQPAAVQCARARSWGRSTIRVARCMTRSGVPRRPRALKSGASQPLPARGPVSVPLRLGLLLGASDLAGCRDFAASVRKP